MEWYMIYLLVGYIYFLSIVFTVHAMRKKYPTTRIKQGSFIKVSAIAMVVVLLYPLLIIGMVYSTFDMHNKLEGIRRELLKFKTIKEEE